MQENLLPDIIISCVHWSQLWHFCCSFREADVKSWVAQWSIVVFMHGYFIKKNDR